MKIKFVTQLQVFVFIGHTKIEYNLLDFESFFSNMSHIVRKIEEEQSCFTAHNKRGSMLRKEYKCRLHYIKN